MMKCNCQLDGQNSVPNRRRDSLCYCVQTSGATQPSYPMDSFQRDNIHDNSYSPTGRLKNEWSFTYSSSICFYDMAHKHRGYFTFSQSIMRFKPQSELNNKTVVVYSATSKLSGNVLLRSYCRQQEQF
jgi:hypothetical protein